MEFLIELLFEILGEVFLENGIDIASDHRLPRWARVLILIVTALVFAAVFGIILMVGIGALRELPLVSLLLFALDAALVFFCIYKVRQVLRARPHQ